MNSIDHSTYTLLTDLLKEVPENKFVTANPWYDLSYSLFAGTKIYSLNDLWKLIAVTYSWMPTIPAVHNHKVEDEVALINRLQCLPDCTEIELNQLLKTLVPVINNSLTGTSKVLHFISPDTIPIIDSNVAKGWNYFFEKTYPIVGITLPKTNYLSVDHSLMYIVRYRKTLLQWKHNCPELSLRQLETAFFQLGQNIKNF